MELFNEHMDLVDKKYKKKVKDKFEEFVRGDDYYYPLDGMTLNITQTGKAEVRFVATPHDLGEFGSIGVLRRLFGKESDTESPQTAAMKDLKLDIRIIAVGDNTLIDEITLTGDRPEQIRNWQFEVF